jgi:hypothetical protein
MPIVHHFLLPLPILKQSVVVSEIIEPKLVYLPQGFTVLNSSVSPSG